MYKVIKFFTDLQDNSHAYRVGDTYPRSGLVVSENRLRELSGYNNKRHTPLIVRHDDPKEPVSLVTEDTLEKEADENTVKKTKAKRRPKKEQE